MCQMGCSKKFLTSSVASLCLIVCAASSQEKPTTRLLDGWRDPHVGEQYRTWLRDEVLYIATDRERTEFKNLTSDEERDEFISAFWERRNPTPGALHNAVEEEHYRRLAYATVHFRAGPVAGWRTDRGRIYIITDRRLPSNLNPGFRRHSRSGVTHL